MAQGFDKSFPSFKSGVTSSLMRDALAALITNNVGPSAPGGTPDTDPELGWFWIDNSNSGQLILNVYDGTAWVPVFDLLNPPSGGGGSGTLAGLLDTNITTPQNGEALVYQNPDWVNGNLAGGGSVSFAYEPLTIVTTNVIPNLPSTPSSNNLVKFYLNGILQPPSNYQVVGQAVTWNPSSDPLVPDVETTDNVLVYYPLLGGTGATNFVLEERTITALNTITDLSTQPSDPSAVLVYINGQLRPITIDYNMIGVTNQEIDWVSLTLNVDTNDRCIVYYQT